MKRLIDEIDIRTEVAVLGEQVTADFCGRPLTVLGVVTGSIVLLSDLIRKIEIPLRVGLIHASSYRGRTTKSSELRINTDLLPDIADRDVVLVDDIFDTGQTLAALTKTIRQYRPHSVHTAVLLWKEGCSKVDLVPDYHCFRIPDVFVVGYGLDYDDDHRHLPYIAVIEEQDL